MIVFSKLRELVCLTLQLAAFQCVINVVKLRKQRWIMSKNNNNAGMRLKRYSQYGGMDDLTYYDNHSTQGIINKRNDILAELEEMGEYPFASPAGCINALEDMDYAAEYNIFLYDKAHEEEIKQVSSVRKLCDSANKSDEIKVRVHDKQKVIYIQDKEYDAVKYFFSRCKKYRIIN